VAAFSSMRLIASSLSSCQRSRAAWPREVPPALALRQRHERVGQGDVSHEPGGREGGPAIRVNAERSLKSGR
jgi:hypothetical protein